MAIQAQWIVLSGEPASQAFDEFVVDGLRLRLQGQLLTLEVEGDVQPADFHARAQEIVRRYEEALMAHEPRFIRFLTQQQFAALPPRPIVVVQQPRAQEVLPQWALRRARQQMLESGDAHLLQCYGYMQDAREDEPGRSRSQVGTLKNKGFQRA
jgi:hypothetical protein